MSNWMNNQNQGNLFSNNFQTNQYPQMGYQTPAMGNVWNRMQQQQQMSLPHYEAPLLHGRAEAESFVMGPNSQIYLPDADEDIIWWIRTDNSGGRNIVALDVSIRPEPQPVTLETIAARLTALEDTINAKQNKSNAKRNRSNNNSAADTASTADAATPSAG